MHFTWLGHGSLRLEAGGQVLLIDPWLDGNPAFPADRRAEATAGATAILITHGHNDHTSGVVELARELSVPVFGLVELMDFWASEYELDVVGFNKGGTVQIGDVAVTMVNAVHSSAITEADGSARFVGSEAGYMIAAEGRCAYVSGDTDVMADMKIWNDLHEPEIGILCAGGHFTMDMTRAAYAASKLFAFKTVIPVHYKTFPVLAQDAQDLIDRLPGVDVRTPGVMERIAV